jgi:putative ABC transport system permease protein
MAVAEPYGLVYSGPEGEEEIRNWNVTREFFSVLDAKPALGRVFDAADYTAGAPPTLVLTYGSWQTRFGGDGSIVGRKITIDHAPATIIGVLPRDFSYLPGRSPQEMYAPKVLDTIELRLRGSAWYVAVARLKPGVTIARGGLDMDRVAAQLEREYSATNARIGVSVVPLRDGMIGDSTRALFLLLGASLVLLLIACTNVANLMLARTNRRAREFVVRTALGAGRARIVRQVLTEGLLLALTGAVAGVLVAYWGVGVIRGLSPDSIPRVDEMRVDWRALAFALVAVPGATVLFALVPAIHAAGPDVEREAEGRHPVVGSCGTAPHPASSHRVRGGACRRAAGQRRAPRAQLRLGRERGSRLPLRPRGRSDPLLLAVGDDPGGAALVRGSLDRAREVLAGRRRCGDHDVPTVDRRDRSRARAVRRRRSLGAR